MVNIDALYRRARRSVVAPDWVKPYLALHPSEARRMLKADFLDGALNKDEEAATRHFIEELTEAERTDSEYPTWNQVIDELVRREEMTDEDWTDGVMNSGLPQRDANGIDNDDKDGE